jgi:hypothetical protein
MANETSSSFSQIEHIAKYPTTTLTRLVRDQKPCSNQGGFAQHQCMWRLKNAATKFYVYGLHIKEAVILECCICMRQQARPNSNVIYLSIPNRETTSKQNCRTASQTSRLAGVFKDGKERVLRRELRTQQNWKEVLTERERDCLLCWEDKDIPSLFEMSHSFLLQTSSSLFNLRAILTLHKASQSGRQAGRQLSSTHNVVRGTEPVHSFIPAVKPQVHDLFPITQEIKTCFKLHHDEASIITITVRDVKQELIV